MRWISPEEFASMDFDKIKIHLLSESAMTLPHWGNTLGIDVEEQHRLRHRGHIKQMVKQVHRHESKN